MHEYIVNLHMHTPYSDGRGTHEEIAQAAIQAGIDVVIVTDHNVWVKGPQGYYGEGDQRLLMLVGEEVHDQTRKPQKNHLLIFGAEKELASFAKDPQQLIDAVKDANGLAFIAHPTDPEAPAFGEADLSWVDWDVQGYTGIELWNAMSEFKSLLKGKLAAIFYAYNPASVAHGPFDEVLKKWDDLLNRGQRVVAVGGSDAHAMIGRLGPLARVLFPYEFHFRAVNTHIYTTEPFGGEAVSDSRLVLDALRQGHAFVGYDLPVSTRGFRFTAQGLGKVAWAGDEIPAANGVTLQIKLPIRTECHLIKNGEIIKTWQDREACTYITTEPGVYRVEAFLFFRGKRRGWIYSNPIYVR
ncbi:MAG: CehA/McbA family metallohydrolase [Anaerolineales bacterium]|nr:CehA/McbA family metallohydrolase [Chloroflexota bacterium]MBL7163413.1 CehA/McbA family metallohydrolase [Anaerolineales bacterium]